MYRRLDPRRSESCKPASLALRQDSTDIISDRMDIQPASLQRWAAHSLSWVNRYYLQHHYRTLLCFTLSQLRQHLHPPRSHLIFLIKGKRIRVFVPGLECPPGALSLAASLLPCACGNRTRKLGLGLGQGGHAAARKSHRCPSWKREG